MARMNGTSQLENTPMIIDGRASQNVGIDGFDCSDWQAAGVIAAKFTGGKVVQPDKIPLSPADPVSSIHINPASILLATSLTVMTKVLLSKKFKDMISPTPAQSLDASLTPENILDRAILQEYYSHNEHPRNVPLRFIKDVQNSPEVGFNSGSDNFDINDNGEFTLKKGNPEREYYALLIRNLAEDCRKSSTAARTDNTRENSSIRNSGDDALTTQIHAVLPDISPEDRAIIHRAHRAITLKDKQQTTNHLARLYFRFIMANRQGRANQGIPQFAESCSPIPTPKVNHRSSTQGTEVYTEGGCDNQYIERRQDQ